MTSDSSNEKHIMESQKGQVKAQGLGLAKASTSSHSLTDADLIEDDRHNMAPFHQHETAPV